MFNPVDMYQKNRNHIQLVMMLKKCEIYLFTNYFFFSVSRLVSER